VLLNAFASKAATSAVIVGTLVMIWDFLLIVLLERQHRYLRLSANWLTLFHYFLVTVPFWKIHVPFCYALRMITVVIKTFARCQLYRLLWPWYLL